MRRQVFTLLLVAYLGLALWLTLRPRPGPEGEPLLLPLIDTWRQMRDLGDRVALREAIGNVLLFVPVGYLVPASFPNMRKLSATVGAGAALSAFIEFGQWWFVKGRSPSVDDVIYNTIGTAIGGALFLLLTGLWRYRRDKAAAKRPRSSTQG